MNINDYTEATIDLLSLASEIEERKRPSYTNGNADVLHNFKRDAEMAGVTMYQNWLQHFLKQVAAISRWARCPDDEQSEPIEQRFADVVNYCKLGHALERERSQFD